ncbi:MAG TPA: universal stress protein, partial [Nitrosomonas sp.]|nr:universal stress protein [Nitrosomonas sp.]
SRTALLTATQWFPQSVVDVFYADKGPNALGSIPGSATLKPADAATHERCERFVTDSGVLRSRIRNIICVDEVLETSLTRYVRQHGVDLVVMGSNENSGLFSALFRNSLSQVLQWISSDVLVIPATNNT